MAKENLGKKIFKEGKKITGKLLKKLFGKYFMIILIITIAVLLVLAILAAAILNIIRLGAVSNSNDSESSNYREYGSGAYYDSVTISEGNVEDVENENVISFEMSVEEMWEKDDRYSTYLNSVEQLEYLLNAEFVTQYPYIESAEEDEINGVIRFFRNDSEEPMVYVSYDTLQGYIDSYNSGDTSVLDTALNVFTLNADGVITIAYLTEESYTVETNDLLAAEDALVQISGSSMTENGDTYVVSTSSSVLQTKNISYVSYVEKYTLPFNLLWSIVVMGNSNKIEAIKLAMSIAEMAYESEISLVIDDNNIETTQVDTYNYEQWYYYTAEEGELNANITETRTTEKYNAFGVKIEDISESTSTHTESGPTVDESKLNNTYTTIYTEYHNENSPSIIIRRIEAWCAIFENDATYEVIESSNSDSTNSTTLNDTDKELTGTTYSVEEADDNGIDTVSQWITELNNSHSDDFKQFDVYEIGPDGDLITYTYMVFYSYSISYTGEVLEWWNYTNINLSSVTSTISTGYNNGTVTSPVFNEAIVEKFNDSNVAHVKSTICSTDNDSWFIKALEVNEDTANMVDLMKYIFNKVYEIESDLDWETIWEELYSNYNSIYGGTSGISGNVGIIFDYLLGKGVSAQGAAAVIGNFSQESGCMPNNLQDTYNIRFGMTDEEYTSAVNSASYSKDSFVNDSGGYGLAQWTYWSRKQALYEFAQSYSSDFDISNIYMQLDFFWEELTTGYTAAYNAIKDATDVETATIAFCNLYEAPGDPHMTNRISTAQQYYNEYLENGTVGTSSSSIVNAAISVHQYVRTNEYKYGAAGTVPNYSGNTVDCSSFVTWVLVEAGVDGFTSGMYQWDSVRFRNNPYGWEEVSVDEAQPGDILCYDGHVEIVANASSNSLNFIVYNCGSDNAIGATGTSILPESSTSGYLKSEVLKVLRVPTD